MAVVAVPFDFPTTTGNIEITDPRAKGTVLGAIFIGAVGADLDGVGGGCVVSLGGADGTNQGYQWLAEADNVTTTARIAGQQNSACLVVRDQPDTNSFIATFTAFIAQGVRVNFTEAIGNGSGICILFTDTGGYEVAEFYASGVVGSNAQTVTCGFQADAGFSGNISYVSFGDTNSTGTFTYNAWERNAGTPLVRTVQHSIISGEPDGKNAPQVNDARFLSNNGNRYNRYHLVENVTSTSYDITEYNFDSGGRYQHFAWKGKAGSDMFLANFDVDANGSFTTTGVGFIPAFTMFTTADGVPRNTETSNNNVDEGVGIHWGFFNDTDAVVHTSTSKDAASPTIAKNRISQTLDALDFSDGASTIWGGSHSFNADGLNIDLTTAPANDSLGHALYFSGGSNVVYAVVTTSSTAPSITQVKNGQDHLGNPATWAGSVVPTDTTPEFSVTGLSAGTNYYSYFYQEDGSADDVILESGVWTTPTATSDGVASSTGAATSAATGTAIAVSTGASTGAATSAATGAAITASTAASTGAATTTGVGEIVPTEATATSTGAATTAATGAAVVTATAASTATATTTAAGAATAASTGAATGTATTTATGTATSASAGAATGVATAAADGAGITTSTGAATGTATTTAAGAATAASTGAATGTATSSAVGQVASTSAVAEADGLATSTATGISTATSTAASTGTATTTAVGEIAATEAVASSTASAVSSAVGVKIFAASGASAGTATSIATGISTAASTAASTGTATTTAVGGVAPTEATGTAAGTAASTAVGAPISVGTAASTSTAVVSATAAPLGAGTAASDGTAASTAQGLGLTAGAGAGSSAGVAAVSGVAALIRAATAASTATAATTFTGAAITAGVASSTATSTTLAAGQAGITVQGTAASTGAATTAGVGVRVKTRELVASSVGTAVSSAAGAVFVDTTATASASAATSFEGAAVITTEGVAASSAVGTVAGVSAELVVEDGVGASAGVTYTSGQSAPGVDFGVDDIPVYRFGDHVAIKADAGPTYVLDVLFAEADNDLIYITDTVTGRQIISGRPYYDMVDEFGNQYGADVNSTVALLNDEFTT